MSLPQHEKTTAPPAVAATFPRHATHSPVAPTSHTTAPADAAGGRGNIVGAFAHLIPPPEPTLADLAREVIRACADDLLDFSDMGRSPWNSRNRFVEARERFQAAHRAVTGLDDQTVARLIEDGLL